MQDFTGQFPAPGGALTGGDAFQVAFYALVSMVVLVGLAHLLARIMNNRKLEEWAKEEFVQVLVSAAIVGGLVALMAPGNGIIIKAFDSLIPQGNDSVIIYVFAMQPTPVTVSSSAQVCIDANVQTGTILCYAYHYLSLLSDQITWTIARSMTLSFFADLFSKISIDIIVVEVTPLSGLSAIVQVLNTTTQTLIFLGITTGVEMALIAFAGAVALNIFLPLGAVLRCFFATRRLGGALIAVAVGAYLIFPLTIALNAVAMKGTEDYGKEIYDGVTRANKAVEDLNMFTQFKSPADLVNPQVWTTYLSSFTTYAVVLVDTIKELPSTYMKMISMLVLQVVFLPMISIMLTMLAIKELAGLLGGEINLSKFEV